MTLFLGACDGDGSDGPGGGGGGSGGSTATTSDSSTEGRVPAKHRATADACPDERPPGDAAAGRAGECMMDADCTAGDNGRCVQDLGQPTVCSYDACKADADCGGGSVCECRNPELHDVNHCVHGNCKVDADCGEGGYCSPSAVVVNYFCTTGIPIGSVGYFCHSAGDECIDDADCGDPGDLKSCFFDVDKMHFACFELLCVN